MKLKSIALSGLAAACTLPAFAEVQLPQVYGRADVSLQSDEVGTADPIWELASNASRLGVHNRHAINDELSVIYRLEYEVDFTERRRSSDRGFMRQRNSYVGLKGGFGTVFAGVHDTPFKKAEGKVDLFSDYYAGDIDEVLSGQNRISDSISYLTPKFNDLQVWLMLVPGEGHDPESGSADSSTGDGPADAISASLTYKTKPLWLALAIDNDLGAQDRLRATAQYIAGPLKLGAILQKTENSEGASQDGLGYVISAALKLNDADVLKAQLTSADDDSLEGLPGAQMLTLGWDHSFAKNTRFYAYFTSISANTDDDDRQVFGTGLRHDFGKSK